MSIDEAIIAGLAHAEKHQLTKPLDIALVIEVALDNAGFKIVRKPGAQRSNFDNQKPHK